MAVVEYYLGAVPVVEPAGPISGGRWRAFWSTADPKMVEAGTGGEFALARIRLAAILLLSVIPINATLRSRAPHNLVGLGIATVAAACAVLVLVMVRARRHRPWLGLATGILDVTMVSTALGLYLVLNQPQMAVNSRVTFLVYFLAIAASAFRYDARICVLVGGAAIAEYVLILLAVVVRVDVHGAAFNASGYGPFEWASQINRLVLLAITTLLTATIVARTQRMLGAITERKQAEADLLTQQQFLRQVIDTNPSLIFVKDWEGRFTLANRAAAAIYGTTPDKLTGETDAAFNANAAEVEHFRRDDREVMTTRSPKFIAEEPVTNPVTGDTRWFQTVKVPLASASGAVRQVLGVATEITQRKELEDRLRQAQRMEAVGQLAGGIAHDFNNILTAVLGFSALLLDDRTLGEHHRRDVQEMHDAAKRAAALTQQLLAFSRRQMLQPTILVVNDAVSGVETLLRRLIGEHIELVAVLATDLGPVRVDRGQLDQVIVNLVVNARDAMPDGGRLTIETSNADLDADFVAVHPGAQPGPHVLLAIGDTGSGMDERTRGRIFEPFFTTKEVGKGSGLGLAVVYGIVKQTGGYVWADSEPGRGSTFRIYLPRAAGGGAAVAAQGAAEVPRGGTETILLVEDEEAVRNMARRALDGFGYQVIEASDGAQAIAAGAACGTSIELLVTDVVMPGMSGPELGERLTRARPELKVLFTSGYADDGILGRGILRPGVAFLPKPYTPETLARRVREVLDAR